MKKILFTLMLLVTAQWACAQTALSIMNEYRNEKKAEYVNVPRAMMSIIAGKVKNDRAQHVLRDVREVKMLTLDDCRKKVRRSFTKKMMELSNKGYEEYTRMKTGDDNILVLVKQGDQYINEIVVLMNDDDDCSAIYVNGNINRSDIGAVVSAVDND